MKHDYTTRMMRPEEFPQMGEWLNANRQANRFDPDIFTYASTQVLAVDKDGSPDLYMPFQVVLMAESLAPRPARTNREMALSIKKAMHALVKKAEEHRIGEVYVLGTEPSVIEFAKAHGFEEVRDVTVLRLKPGKLTPPPEEK
jgi:hypothetical protein